MAHKAEAVASYNFNPSDKLLLDPVQMIDYGSLAVPANSIPALELLENTTTAAFISLTTAATGTAALAMDVGCALYFNLTYEAA